MELDKNSMLYWHPRIKDLPIPQPKTEIVKLTKKEKDKYYRSEIPLDELTNRVKNKIFSSFKLPVFLRTDQLSAKHLWDRSCFLKDTTDLERHLFEIITESKCAGIFGLPIEAIAVREYIEMDSKFTAFLGYMPINTERRYFIKNNKVQCRHPYWIEGAIGESLKSLPKNWKELLKKTNIQTKEEIELLTNYANKVAEVIDGYWSVDFCKGKDGKFYLIDMAKGDESWHPNCKFKLTENKKGA